MRFGIHVCFLLNFQNPINNLGCFGLWVFSSDEDSSYCKCGWKQINSYRVSQSVKQWFVVLSVD
jgi:hypothetical protein